MIFFFLYILIVINSPIKRYGARTDNVGVLPTLPYQSDQYQSDQFQCDPVPTTGSPGGVFVVTPARVVPTAGRCRSGSWAGVKRRGLLAVAVWPTSVSAGNAPSGPETPRSGQLEPTFRPPRREAEFRNDEMQTEKRRYTDTGMAAETGGGDGLG